MKSDPGVPQCGAPGSLVFRSQQGRVDGVVPEVELPVPLAHRAQHAAGVAPTATTLSGRSLVTTLPAPTTTLSPRVTPGSSTAPAPIQQFLPMRMGALYW